MTFKVFFTFWLTYIFSVFSISEYRDLSKEINFMRRKLRNKVRVAIKYKRKFIHTGRDLMEERITATSKDVQKNRNLQSGDDMRKREKNMKNKRKESKD